MIRAFIILCVVSYAAAVATQVTPLDSCVDPGPATCSSDCGQTGWQKVACNGGATAQLCNWEPCDDECKKCKKINSVGYIADSFDCRKFFQCEKQRKQQYNINHMNCGDCTTWDEDICTCSWADCKTCISGAILLFSDNELTTLVGIVTALSDTTTHANVAAFVIIGNCEWEITVGSDTDTYEEGSYQMTAADITELKKKAVHFAGIDVGGPVGHYSHCYSNCTFPYDPAAAPQTKGQKSRQIFYDEQPDNWCDNDCGIEPEIESCDNPDPCPTAPSLEDCPKMICLEFEENTLDSCYNVSVEAVDGAVSYNVENNLNWATTITPTNHVGVFAGGDSLKIEFFNNYFDEENGAKFTVAFFINVGNPPFDGTVFTNGCDDPLTGGIEPSFLVYLTTVVTTNGDKAPMLHAKVNGACHVSRDFSSNTYIMFIITYDGQALSIIRDCKPAIGLGADPPATATCTTGPIRNNKCPLVIGHDNIDGSSSYFNGELDMVRFFRSAEVPFDDKPCICPDSI